MIAPPTSHQGTNQICSGAILCCEVDVGADVDDAPDRPSQGHAQRAAQHAHDARLREKQFLHVAITRPDRLHDSDFTPPLENRHHQRVNNADRGNRQSQAAEDAEKDIDDGEKLPQAARGVEHREGVEAHLLDGVLDGLNLRGTLYAHADRGIRRNSAGRLRGIAHGGGLHGVQALHQLQRQQHTGTRRPAHAIGIEVGDADNLQLQLMRLDGVGGGVGAEFGLEYPAMA